MSDPNKLPETPPDPVYLMHMQAMREMAEPRDGVSPTPVSYLILVFFYLLAGGTYLGYYWGNFDGNGLAERPAGNGAAVAAPPQDPMVLGKEVYGSCTQCHQENGLGQPGQTPPLAGSEFVTGDARRLVAILLNGINGELIVKGQPYASQMPAWGEIKDDEEIAAVATYIRATWGNKAPLVTREFAAGVRKEVAGKGEWRAHTLEAFVNAAPAAAPAAGK